MTGDLNWWNPASHPMRRREDGWWFIEVQLTHGHHQYLFLVDGRPVLDPKGTGIARNERNERVSLIAVSRIVRRKINSSCGKNRDGGNDFF
jgi:1,4-alpha-glucan branching enzyme